MLFVLQYMAANYQRIDKTLSSQQHSSFNLWIDLKENITYIKFIKPLSKSIAFVCHIQAEHRRLVSGVKPKPKDHVLFALY